MHDGGQVWYMNTTDTMPLLVNSPNNITPAGDAADHNGAGQGKAGAVHNEPPAHGEDMLFWESDGGLMRFSRSRRTGP
jgi:hypothetical protein